MRPTKIPVKRTRWRSAEIQVLINALLSQIQNLREVPWIEAIRMAQKTLPTDRRRDNPSTPRTCPPLFAAMEVAGIHAVKEEGKGGVWTIFLSKGRPQTGTASRSMHTNPGSQVDDPALQKWIEATIDRKLMSITLRLTNIESRMRDSTLIVNMPRNDNHQLQAEIEELRREVQKLRHTHVPGAGREVILFGRPAEVVQQIQKARPDITITMMNGQCHVSHDTPVIVASRLARYVTGGRVVIVDEGRGAIPKILEAIRNVFGDS